jgi:hypothetical protein
MVIAAEKICWLLLKSSEVDIQYYVKLLDTIKADLTQVRNILTNAAAINVGMRFA